MMNSQESFAPDGRGPHVRSKREIALRKMETLPGEKIDGQRYLARHSLQEGSRRWSFISIKNPNLLLP